MFNEILEYCDNDDIKELIISAFALSKSKNKENSELVLKKLQLSLEGGMRIEKSQISNSQYDPFSDIISMNQMSIIVFFHELTHSFSYRFDRFNIPEEFIEFKTAFFDDNRNTSSIMELLRLCQEKREYISEEMRLNQTKNINDNGLSLIDKNTIEIDVINHIEDIVDAIYSGISGDFGLMDSGSNQSIVKKQRSTCGHGCEYYDNTSYQFEEIIADYNAIRLTDPNNELFKIIKVVLGDKFVCFLDSRCDKLSKNEEKRLDDIDINPIRR